MWKIIIDADPAKRRMDMQRTIEQARIEAMYQATQHALTGEATRAALMDYGRTYEDAMARNIRDSAPQITPPPAQRTNGHRPADADTLHADAPKLARRPKASPATSGDDAGEDGRSGA